VGGLQDFEDVCRTEPNDADDNDDDVILKVVLLHFRKFIEL